MLLDIRISADSDSATDMTALAALIASLSSRTPVPIRLDSDRPKHLDESTAIKVREPGDDEGEPRNIDTSELDAEIVDAAVVAGAPAYDSAGLPWDDRIHASSRATLQDGTWRRRKNTDDALYESVMTELRAAHPTDTPPPPPPPATTTSDTPEPPASTSADTAPAADAATSADDTPPPPADSAPDMSTFAKFVSAVNGKDVPAEAKVYAALNKLAKETFGVDAFKDMLGKPNDWQLFYDMVG